MNQKISETALPDTLEKLIDVEKAIKSKNPKLLKFLPAFLLRYIKRVLHEVELNDANNRFIQNYEHDFVESAMKEFGVNVKVIGVENIPKVGGIILAANHPLGALDGIAFMKVVGARRKDIRFLVNDLLLAIKNFGQLFIPVNKHGRNSGDYIETIDKVYSSGHCLLVFPAGLVSRRQKKGLIEDLIWKKSFISKAVLNKKNIVPVFIEGRNSNFFYNLAYWRKKIGVKANIEMLYLVDEMYKQKDKTLTFIIGEQISWETFTPDKRDEYWAEKVKRHVYALKSGDKSKMLTTKKVQS
jgi:putative hemolysin